MHNSLRRDFGKVKSCLRCEYSAIKHISIDKAWNKQHRLGERPLKQSLKPSLHSMTVKFQYYRWSTKHKFKTKQKQRNQKCTQFMVNYKKKSLKSRTVYITHKNSCWEKSMLRSCWAESPGSFYLLLMRKRGYAKPKSQCSTLLVFGVFQSPDNRMAEGLQTIVFPIVDLIAVSYKRRRVSIRPERFPVFDQPPTRDAHNVEYKHNHKHQTSWRWQHPTSAFSPTSSDPKWLLCVLLKLVHD